MGAHVTLRAPLEEEPRMKIKSQKDFWSGLMFIGSGLFFAVWAMEFYQMGTAVRMGPAYFPTVLGFLLAVLGGLVLLQSLTLAPEGDHRLWLPDEAARAGHRDRGAGLHQRARRPRVQVEGSDYSLHHPHPVFGPGVREGPHAALPDLARVLRLRRRIHGPDLPQPRH